MKPCEGTDSSTLHRDKAVVLLGLIKTVFDLKETFVFNPIFLINITADSVFFGINISTTAVETWISEAETCQTIDSYLFCVLICTVRRPLSILFFPPCADSHAKKHILILENYCGKVLDKHLKDGNTHAQIPFQCGFLILTLLRWFDLFFVFFLHLLILFPLWSLSPFSCRPLYLTSRHNQPACENTIKKKNGCLFFLYFDPLPSTSSSSQTPRALSEPSIDG